MRCLKLFGRVAAVMLAIALVPTAASAQDADTLSISGTFHMGFLDRTVGDDLAAVFANGNEHTWTLTLYGVWCSHDYYYVEWNDVWSYGHHEQYITRLHATSFDFQFFGPDADALNAIVSQQLARGGLTGGGFLEVWNGDYFDSLDALSPGPYAAWNLRLRPLESDPGLSFDVNNWWVYPFFATDEFGYPVIEPRRFYPEESFIGDFRPGNSGLLYSLDDVVDIGSSEPPVLPPTLNIADGSVREGNKGTSRLELTVGLSQSSYDTVTVNYQTANGTALAGYDYFSTSGTLTFQPSETSRTISVAIKGDRKREPNETFSVKLSNAVGATIGDGIVTATILNDD